MANTPNDDFSSAEDDGYFEEATRKSRPQSFDVSLLRQPLTVLPNRRPVVFTSKTSVSEAMRAMKSEHRGYVLITEDGTLASRLSGIFTERDILNRVIDQGRNPSTLALGDVMTADPETLPRTASIAWVLNKMEIGGFRHIIAVDDVGRPVCVVAVRDVVSFLVDAFPREILNLPPVVEEARYDTREGA